MPSTNNTAPVLAGTEAEDRQQTTSATSVARASAGGKPVDVALRYAAIGWHVFPCRPDKTPFTENGFLDATTDAATVRAMWQRWPGAQIGIATGASGLVVLDLDVADDRDGIAALEAIAGARHHGASLIATTPRGGRHLVYRADPARPVKCSARRDGIDVRAAGGYIVAPGPSSPGREWIEGEPGDQLEQVPEWIRAEVLSPAQDKPAAPMPEPSQAGNATDAELREVTSALATVPSSLGRPEWLRAILGAHAALSADPRGAGLVERWSATTTVADQYRAGEATAIYRKAVLPWLMPPGDRQLVDKDSLFSLAYDHGWAGRPVAPNAAESRPSGDSDDRLPIIIGDRRNMLRMAQHALRADASLRDRDGWLCDADGNQLGPVQVADLLAERCAWSRAQGGRLVPAEPPRSIVDALSVRRTDWGLPRIDAEYRVTDWADLLREPPLEWRIDEWLPEQGLGVLCAAPGVGKTFLVMDMACCLAHGKDWAGLLPVDGRCGTLYVAGEGQAGLPGRARAWEAHYRPATTGKLIRFVDPIPPPTDTATWRELLRDYKRAAGEAPGLVVIDTFSQALAEGSENDSETVAPAMRALLRMAREHGTTFLVVHHPRKAGEKEATERRLKVEDLRGSSALLGNSDFVWLASKIDGTILLESGKTKDGRAPEPVTMALRGIATGKTRRNAMVEFSAVVEPAGVTVEQLAKSKEDAVAASKEQRAERAAAERAAAVDALAKQVAEVLRDQFAGRCTSQSALAQYLPGRQQTRLAGIAAAISRGLIVRDERSARDYVLRLPGFGDTHTPHTPQDRVPGTGPSADARASTGSTQVLMGTAGTTGTGDLVPLVPGTDSEPGTASPDDGRPPAPGGRRRRSKKVVQP